MFSCPVFVACGKREGEGGGGGCRNRRERRGDLSVKNGIGCTDPFVEDLSPLFRQSPVKHDRPRLLGWLVNREVLTDHTADDVSQLCRLQSSCGDLQTLLLSSCQCNLVTLLAISRTRKGDNDDPRLILGFLSTSSHSAPPPPPPPLPVCSASSIRNMNKPRCRA